MEISPAGLHEIELSEGFSSRPYLDRVASPPVWTIGFGETNGITANTPPISRAEAERRLKTRFSTHYGPALEPFVGLNGFNQNMFDALASFVWNCGPGAVGPGTTIGKHLRACRFPDAGDALLAWCKTGNGKVVPGLLARRNRERAMFLQPAADDTPHYLTDWERKTVEVLLQERRIAARHGGWDKVDDSHLKRAARAKADLRERVALLEQRGLAKPHRRERVESIRAVIVVK
jgi:lysozyme